jgi:hypothetical protein
MTLMNLRLLAARAGVMAFVKTANRKERDHALRDALHFSAVDEH